MGDPNPTPREASPASTVPTRITVRHLVTISAWLVVIGASVYFFDAIRFILLGFLAAGCLASTAHPLMRYIPGPHVVKGAVAGAVPIVVAAGMLFLVGWLFLEPIRHELEQWPLIKANLDDLLAHWSGALGLSGNVTVDSLLEQLRGYLMGHGSLVSTASGITINVLIAVVFIFLGCLFLLIERGEHFLGGFLKLLPPRRRPQFKAAIADLEPRLRWWVMGTFLGMLIIGAATYGGYRMVGLRFALPLAVLAGLSEIVPTVGPTFAFIVAELVAATQGVSVLLAVAVLYLVIEFIEAHVLMPVVMRQAINLPPVITLFTVVFWGMALGIGGLLLALPINLVLWTFADHFIIRQHQTAPDAPPAREAH